MPVARGITASLFVAFASTPDVLQHRSQRCICFHVISWFAASFFCSIVLCIAFASMLYPGTAASFFIGISRCQL